MKTNLIDELTNDFSKLFGEGDKPLVFFAPGRVNLIGEHTDYNGGHVFPCALTIGTYGIVRKRNDDIIRFFSKNFEEDGIISGKIADIKIDKNSWTKFPKGVMSVFIVKGYSFSNGFDLLVYGDIPNGSGLSSSASLEVLTGIILRELYSFDKETNIDIALIGQNAECNYVGCNCGIMDQFASAMGKKDNAIYLDTGTLNYEYASIKLPNAKIVITNSNVKHNLASSGYNDRRRECENALADLQKTLNINSLCELTVDEFEKNKELITDEISRKRAKHAIYENERTLNAIKALNAGDIGSFGKLMIQSHISLRDDYEVSCKEIDFLVDEALKINGVMGSRITGGGFGGCTVSIVNNDSIDSFTETISKKYFEKFGLNAECYVVEIGDGARRL